MTFNNSYSGRALTKAVATQCTSVIEVILTDRDIDINYLCWVKDMHVQPIHAAAHHNDLEMIKYLLAQEEIEMNATVRSNNTPLEFAIEAGHIEATKLLVQHWDTNFNHQNIYGSNTARISTQIFKTRTATHLYIAQCCMTIWTLLGHSSLMIA
jgi:hypothetical protein